MLERDKSYGLDVDPTIRAHACLLRKQLKTYYSGIGINDPVAIELPPKTHLLRIRWKAAGKPEVNQAESSAPVASFHRFHRPEADTEDQFVCQGVAGELLEIMRTSKVLLMKFLRAPELSSNSVALQATSKIDARLHCMLRTAGERVRISVQLTSAMDGSVIWSEIYECKSNDLTEVRRQITSSVAIRVLSTWHIEGWSLCDS